MDEGADKETGKHLGRRIGAAFERPITYVALLAIVVAGVALYASVVHRYGPRLPVYALELPFLLHLIHTAVAFGIVALAGGVAVKYFQGDGPEELGAGPFSVALGRSSKTAIRELREAVGALRKGHKALEDDHRRADERMVLMERSQAALQGLPGGTDGGQEGEASQDEGNGTTFGPPAEGG